MALRFTTRRLVVLTTAVAIAAAGVGWIGREYLRARARISLVYHWQDKFDRGEITREQAREKVGDIVDNW
jgi:hypothetical protein